MTLKSIGYYKERFLQGVEEAYEEKLVVEPNRCLAGLRKKHG